MPDKKTREKLLNSAKEEFMQYGFDKASLRKICKNAGVTTGALYFFFKDKNDLFSCLVDEVYEQIKMKLQHHYQMEKEFMLKQSKRSLESDQEDVVMARHAITFIYEHLDEFHLLLEKSLGSKFENCVEEIIQMTDEHYHVLFKYMVRQNYGEEIDDFTIHWFSHLQTEAFVHIIKHHLSYEEAVKQTDLMIGFLMGGWSGICDVLKEKGSDKN